MGKLDELIQAIAESGNEKVMSAFLEWQDEGIKAKERLIEKMDKLLKTSEGKPETTSENSLHKHFVSGLLPSDKEVEDWFVLNIDNDSASSAIYKFRLWLQERWRQ